MSCQICGSPTADGRGYCASCTEQAVQGVGPISAAEPPPLSHRMAPPPIPSARDGIPSLSPGHESPRPGPSGFAVGLGLVLIFGVSLLVFSLTMPGKDWAERLGAASAPLLIGALIAAFPWKSRGRALLVASFVVLILSALGQAGHFSQRVQERQDLVRAQKDFARSLSDNSTVAPPPESHVDATDGALGSDAAQAKVVRQVMVLRQNFLQHVKQNNTRMESLQLEEMLSAQRLVSAEGLHRSRDTLTQASTLIEDNRHSVDQYLAQAGALIDSLPSGPREQMREGFDRTSKPAVAMLASLFQDEHIFTDRADRMLTMAEQNLGRWRVEGDKLIVGHGQLAPYQQLVRDIQASAQDEVRLHKEMQAMEDSNRASVQKALL
ncbi:hypothetical protein [Dyella sp.]|uniref:hypothetical protein n=1 Tax=Dyella sp. TaxID=1869338 RepID=UPI002ED0157F